MPVYVLSDLNTVFPDPDMAEKDGLLALGGDISAQRLIAAYRAGIFPWYSDDSSVLWWSPDPRCVLFPAELHVPHSLRRVIKKGRYHCTFDTAFAQVIWACSSVNSRGKEGTWITSDMIEGYTDLYLQGLAHSVEAWDDNELVGGLYGISLGNMFFGESMFFTKPDASKVAFVFLMDHIMQYGFTLVDCQQETENLLRFGARSIPRQQYLALLKKGLQHPTHFGPWNTAIHVSDDVVES